MDFFNILACSPPFIVTLMVAASIVHALSAARKSPPGERFLRPRVVIVCLLHLVFAAAVYCHLVKDGWLNTQYHWDDPNNINLVLGIFETLCAVAVAALAIARKSFFYKLLLDLLMIQLIIATCLLVLLLVFVLTWQPRMM